MQIRLRKSDLLPLAAESSASPTLSTFKKRIKRQKVVLRKYIVLAALNFLQRLKDTVHKPNNNTTQRVHYFFNPKTFKMPLKSIHRSSCHSSSTGGGAHRGRVFVKGFDYYGNLIVEDKKTRHPTPTATKKWNTIRDITEDDCREFLVDEPTNNDNSDTTADAANNINPSCVGEFFTCFQLNVKDFTTCEEKDVGDEGMTATAAYHAGRADAYMTAAAAAAAMARNTHIYDSYYVPPTPALAATGGQQYYASPTIIDYPYNRGGTSQKSPLAAAMYYPPPQLRMQQLPVRME